MKRLSIKSLFLLPVVIIVAIFLNRYVLKDRLIFYPRSLINFSSYLFVKAENFGDFVEKVKNFNRLASEEDKLKNDQKIVLGLKAKIDNLKDENDFLRRAVKISQKFDYLFVYAGIFNLNFSPTGYNVLLNKGVRDGISEGDIVVTAEGVLVGKIQRVMQNFSRVLFVSDPEFKITTKVMSSGTTGIAQGASNDGMYLNFVVQEDEIKDGDVLISTGSDLFPPALVIGSVDHIEANTTQMFKKVRIRPAIKDIRLGKVLVIKMK